MKKALFIFILFTNANAFDPPKNDPWYYSSNDNIMFMIPDKAQHYWGSYALNSIGSKHLGDIESVIVTFVIGFLWEVKDEKMNVGFSYKDLAADGLGILSSVVNRSKRTRLWLNYDTLDKQITFNISVKI